MSERPRRHPDDADPTGNRAERGDAMPYRSANLGAAPSGRVKELVKRLIPEAIMRRRRRRIAARMQREFADLPIEQTFTRIYETNLWGGRPGEFFSGTGSTGKYVDAYAETVRDFIVQRGIRRVADLGCGDYYTASRFIDPHLHYVGCDVVPELVERLNRRYGRAQVEFRTLDITRDELPDAELCLLRQVLQHLSNDEIERVLRRAGKYRHVLITEHYPAPEARLVPNLDIPHGPQIRLHFNSAVVLDEPPFALRDVRLLLDVEAEEGTRIKTFLVPGAALSR